MIFKWDPAKAATNLKKHSVGFHEAASVLQDPLSMTFPDDDHSRHESRFLTVGLSSKQRLLVVSHTEERFSTVRIISARAASKSERRFYEEGT